MWIAAAEALHSILVGTACLFIRHAQEVFIACISCCALFVPLRLVLVIAGILVFFGHPLHCRQQASALWYLGSLYCILSIPLVVGASVLLGWQRTSFPMFVRDKSWTSAVAATANGQSHR